LDVAPRKIHFQSVSLGAEAAAASKCIGPDRFRTGENGFGAGWPDGLQVVHNEEYHMGGTLNLGNALVDEVALTELCRRYHVRELSVFGSAARGDMRPSSDIDLLVEFLPDAEVDLVDHAGLMLDLARLLGRKVDLVSKNGLKPLIRASVLEEARLLYAA
jgi:predicted nucleotidyltransferase